MQNTDQGLAQPSDTRRQRARAALPVLSAGLAVLLGAGPVLADAPLRALIAVSGTEGAGLGASALSRAAMAHGGEVRRLEAPAAADLQRAMTAARSPSENGPRSGVLVVALAAPSRLDDDGGTLLHGFGPQPVALSQLLDDLVGPLLATPEGTGSVAGEALARLTLLLPMPPRVPAPVSAPEVLLVLDACAADAVSRTGEVAPRPGLALALLPAPGAACPEAGAPGLLPALAEAMGGQGDMARLAANVGGLWLTEPGAPAPALYRVASAAPVSTGPAGGPVAGGPASGDPILASLPQPAGRDVIFLGGPTPMQGARAVLPGRQPQATGDTDTSAPTPAGAAPAGARAGDEAFPAPTASGGLELRPPRRNAGAPATGGIPTVAPDAAAVGLAPDTPPPAAGFGQIRQQVQLAALPVAAGLPRPSIIVGEIVSASPATPPGATDVGALSGIEMGTEDRARIRAQDATLYASLVEQGVFDPAPEALNAALQSELARMGCYRGAVDGAWGNGSRSAVDAYFQRAGGSPVTREADVTLFRQIIAGAEVTCPAPAQPVGARQPSTGSTSPAPGRPTPTQPRPQPPAAPVGAQQPNVQPSGGGLLNATIGSGFQG